MTDDGGHSRVEDRVDMVNGRSQASNLQPPTSNLPIIAMTAHAMAGDEEKSLKVGMNGHVAKPIDPDNLFATLRNWIKPGVRRDDATAPNVTPAPSVPDQLKVIDEELPESLAGFDLAAGLGRLMGNKRLYRKLLLDFGSKYTGVAGEIRNALDKRDFQQAHSLVHNLKGLAGNLAAIDLQAATVEMEKLIKGDQKKCLTSEQLNQKLTTLEEAVGVALQAVKTLGPATEEKSSAPSIGVIPEVSSDLIKETTARIREAAEMGDIGQVDSIAEELKSRSDGLTDVCNQFIQLAEEFDFDGILKLADELEGNA